MDKMTVDLDKIRVVRLETDDVLVFFHPGPGRMSMRQVDQLDARIGAAFPGRKFLVLQEGLTLAALRPKKVCQCESELSPESENLLGPHHQQSCPLYVDFQRRKKPSHA